MCSPEVELVPLPMPDDFDSQVVGGFDRPLQCMAWWRQSYPEFLRPEVLQYGLHSSDMVGVCVGDGNGVEIRYAARPEVGRDHVFPEIKL